ncbi:hypothetical protein, partial [Stutzerimonas kunmingensis]|uniref:hypothetical protein n=1 Tax=Stutzerimonas kunmingensis TaxID=1211807 RepID=UPI003D03B8C0
SASAKVICFIGKLGEWSPGILPKSGSLLQSFPNCINHVFHVFGSPEDLPSLMTGRCDVMYVAAEP